MMTLTSRVGFTLGGNGATTAKGDAMDGARFDRFTEELTRRGVLRALSAVLAAGGGMATTLPTAARDRNCNEFILAAGDDPDKEFRHVDDDFKVELRRRRSRRWNTIFEDDDGEINNGGEHIRPITFRADYGDKIRITAINAVSGGCGLDKVVLFCKGRRRGRKLMGRYRCSSEEGNQIGVFLVEEFRLKP